MSVFTRELNVLKIDIAAGVKRRDVSSFACLLASRISFPYFTLTLALG